MKKRLLFVSVLMMAALYGNAQTPTKSTENKESSKPQKAQADSTVKKESGKDQQPEKKEKRRGAITEKGVSTSKNKSNTTKETPAAKPTSTASSSGSR